MIPTKDKNVAYNLTEFVNKNSHYLNLSNSGYFKC